MVALPSWMAKHWAEFSNISATTNSKSIIKTVGKLDYATEVHNGLQNVDFHKAKHILPFHITILLVPFYFKHTAYTKLTRHWLRISSFDWVNKTETAGTCKMVHTAQPTPKQQLCKSPLVTAHCQSIYGHQNLQTFLCWTSFHGVI
jgi:hypothetical protein